MSLDLIPKIDDGTQKIESVTFNYSGDPKFWFWLDVHTHDKGEAYAVHANGENST
jgi:hypothetical protein